MTSPDGSADDPHTTPQQLATAMMALGLYTGRNTPDEHAEEAGRLGGLNAYRLCLVNALLGGVQIEALLSDARGRRTTSVGWVLDYGIGPHRQHSLAH